MTATPVNDWVREMRRLFAPTVLTLTHADDGNGRVIGTEPVRHPNPFMWEETTPMVPEKKPRGKK